MTESDKRIIFRPTDKQHQRLNTIFNQADRYKTISELLRHILEIGMDKIEEKYKFKNQICPVCGEPIDRQQYVLKDGKKYHMECVK